jgi:hypothetical protein
MRIVKVKLEGFAGPTCYRDVDSAMEEIRMLVESGLSADFPDNTPVHITFLDMDEDEFDKLPESMGY